MQYFISLFAVDTVGVAASLLSTPLTSLFAYVACHQNLPFFHFGPISCATGKKTDGRVCYQHHQGNFFHHIQVVEVQKEFDKTKIIISI
jgi:hypothetical protein